MVLVNSALKTFDFVQQDFKIKMLRPMKFSITCVFSCEPWAAPKEGAGPLFSALFMKN